MVNKADYKLMMDKAVAELTELLDRQAELDTERDQMDSRIAELKQGIMALGPLCGMSAHLKYSELMPEYGLLPVGLREGVIAVLAMIRGDGYMTPVGVRDNLPSTGYEIKSKNILPSIHNVLKRLDGREVESADVNGKTGYRLIKKDRPAPAPPNPFAGLMLKRRTTSESTVPKRQSLAEAFGLETTPVLENILAPKRKKD